MSDGATRADFWIDTVGDRKVTKTAVEEGTVSWVDALEFARSIRSKYLR